MTPEERQQAKQICYGMIYGIGTSSLAEQLDVVEEEAAVFISDFKSAYPGVKAFMEKTVEECRKSGFVQTMSGRRRYLPAITGSANHFARAAAERQAVNTTIQGINEPIIQGLLLILDFNENQPTQHWGKILKITLNILTLNAKTRWVTNFQPICLKNGEVL